MAQMSSKSVIGFLIGVLAGVGLLLGPMTLSEVLWPPEEVDLPPVHASAPKEACEAVWGPVPTPRDGWEAWGMVCPEGAIPNET